MRIENLPLEIHDSLDLGHIIILNQAGRAVALLDKTLPEAHALATIFVNAVNKED